ncbi:hypothetical protein ACI65C_009553, partial [Semiaphis heraclei]
FYTERGYWYYTVYLSRTIPLRHQCDYRLHIQRCRVVTCRYDSGYIFSLTHARAPGRIAISHRFQLFSVTKRHTYRRRSLLEIQVSVVSDRQPTAPLVSLIRYEEEDQ